MVLSWFGTMIDSRDPDHLAQFWCDALGYVIVYRNDKMVAIAPDSDTHPGLAFVRTNAAKTTKNRVHLDLRPDNQDDEVDRLVKLGATPIDIGQRADTSWIVMADPEGNEFCILAAWHD